MDYDETVKKLRLKILMTQDFFKTYCLPLLWL